MGTAASKVTGRLLTTTLVVLAVVLATAGTAAAFPGQFDPAFGTGGATINQFSSAPSPLSIGVDIAPAPEGKVVACGEVADIEGHIALGVARYLSNGALDPSFGTGGVAILQEGLVGEKEGKPTPPESTCLYSGLTVLPDGRIVLVGAASNKEGKYSGLVMRLKTNGEPDPSFGGGVLRQALGEGATPNAELFGVAIQPDEKVVATGFATDAEGHTEFVAERLSSGGVLDASFGKAGVFRQQLGKDATTPSSAGTDVIVQPSGQLIFSGQANKDKGGYFFMLVALTSGGKLNPGFGTAGGVTTYLPGPDPTGEATSYRVVEQSSGRLVLGGTAPFDEAGDFGYAVAGFTSSGLLDTSFGTGGATLTPLSPAAEPRAQGVGLVRESNDKLVLPGIVTVNNKTNRLLLGVVRYTAGGQLDPTFAEGGVLERTFEPGEESGSASIGAAIDASGRLLLAGASAPEPNNLKFLAGRVLLEEPAPPGPPPPPPPPPPGPTFNGVTLGGSTLTMDSHGNVVIKLGSAFNATGTVTLTSASAVKADVASVLNALLATSKKAKKLKLGSAKFSLVAGHAKRVKVHLSKKAQALIRRQHKLRTSVSVTATAIGQSKHTAFRVTIKPAKTKKKH
jgi:uncharacterized delta-60 repeat protein